MVSPIPRRARNIPLGFTLWGLGCRNSSNIQSVFREYEIIVPGMTVAEDGSNQAMVNIPYAKQRGFDGILRQALRVVGAFQDGPLSGFTFKFQPGGLATGVESRARSSMARVGHALAGKFDKPEEELVRPLLLDVNDRQERALLRAKLEVGFFPMKKHMVVRGEEVSHQDVRNCLLVLGRRLVPGVFAA